jgi:hypothetical protein
MQQHHQCNVERLDEGVVSQPPWEAIASINLDVTP